MTTDEIITNINNEIYSLLNPRRTIIRRNATVIEPCPAIVVRPRAVVSIEQKKAKFSEKHLDDIRRQRAHIIPKKEEINNFNPSNKLSSKPVTKLLIDAKPLAVNGIRLELKRKNNAPQNTYYLFLNGERLCHYEGYYTAVCNWKTTSNDWLLHIQEDDTVKIKPKTRFDTKRCLTFYSQGIKFKLKKCSKYQKNQLIMIAHEDVKLLNEQSNK